MLNSDFTQGGLFLIKQNFYFLTQFEMEKQQENKDSVDIKSGARFKSLFMKLKFLQWFTKRILVIFQKKDYYQENKNCHQFYKPKKSRQDFFFLQWNFYNYPVNSIISCDNPKHRYQVIQAVRKYILYYIYFSSSIPLYVSP